MKHNIITLPNVKIKTINSDFMVDEIYLEPQLSAKDRALYTYLFVRKENLTTFTLLSILADYFQLAVEDVSASGLKDEQAIARQIISIGAILSDKEIKRANDFFRNEQLIVSICHIIGYGKKPVYRRMLHGNKFSITMRNVDIALAQALEDYLKANKFFNFINYYDEQRFGLPDSIHNTHLIGKRLLANEWREAYQEYLKSGNEQSEIERVKSTFAKSKSYYESLLAIMPSKLGFFISSYNSFLWNTRLKEEIGSLKDTIQAEIPYIGVISLPADSSAAIPTMLSIPVEKKNWQTGENFLAEKKRPVVISVPVYVLDKTDDKLHQGTQAVSIAFYLPTGCYATMLVKQLLLSKCP